MKSSSKLPKCPVEIPKGWKRLSHGSVLMASDKCLFGGCSWQETANPGWKVGTNKTRSLRGYLIYIRRKSVRPTTKQGGGK